MLGIYEKIVRAYQNGMVDFQKVRTFNLDEYLGFDTQDPITFHSYMNKTLFSKININPKNTHIPPSMPKNIESASHSVASLSIQPLMKFRCS